MKRKGFLEQFLKPVAQGELFPARDVERPRRLLHKRLVGADTICRQGAYAPEPTEFHQQPRGVRVGPPRPRPHTAARLGHFARAALP